MSLWSDLSRPPLRTADLTRLPWRAVEVVAETGSTNADLVARARAGEAAGLVLVADHQTAGRGRRDRRWSSPPRAGIAMSVLLRPDTVPLARWSWLSLLAGVAVTDVLITVCGLPAVLKWPNDVLVPPRPGADPLDHLKLAGLLAEVVVGAGGPAVVLGLGLNVSQQQDELPVPTATSLRLAGAAGADRVPLLRALLRRLAERYVAWTDAAGDPRASGIAAVYRERCQTIGLQVRVALPDGSELDGVAEGVDDEGRLLVRDAGDDCLALAAGDVVHVRPGRAEPPSGMI